MTGFSVIHKADEFYQDWYHAKEVCGSVVRESNDVGVMESLPIGYTKCNVDASFKQHSNLTRAGMCTWDHHGKIIVIRTNFIEPCMSVLEGEARALNASISFTIRRGYQNVIFVINYKTIMDKIKSKAADNSKLGHICIVQHCRSLIHSNHICHWICQETSQ